MNATLSMHADSPHGSNFVTSKDGTPIYFKDWGRGPVIVFSHGWPLNADAWDGQMRQPILIAGPRLLVSVSPQPGFLHRGSELDTLGHDREESRCKP